MMLKIKDEINLKNNKELFTSFVNTIDNIYNLSSLSQLEKMFKDNSYPKHTSFFDNAKKYN